MRDIIQAELAKYGMGLLTRKLDGSVTECEAQTRKILSLISEEIEKVENPIQKVKGIPQDDFINYDRGFDRAKYLILSLFKE